MALHRGILPVVRQRLLLQAASGPAEGLPADQMVEHKIPVAVQIMWQEAQARGTGRILEAMRVVAETNKMPSSNSRVFPILPRMPC